MRQVSERSPDRRIDGPATRDYETSCALTIISRPFGLTLRLYGSLDRGLRISTSGVSYQARGVGRIRLDQERGKRTESILFVFAARTESETPIILAHPTVDAIAETLVEVHRDRVRAADVEIDEQPAVYLVRRFLEEAHEDARER
jgi:hypothetical protein